MCVQVGEAVAERLVVHLQRPVVPLKRSGHLQHFQPVPAGFLGLQVCWLCNMPPSPDDHGVAALNRCTLEVGVAVLAGRDANAVLILIWTTSGAHGAGFAAVERRPVARPSVHRCAFSLSGSAHSNTNSCRSPTYRSSAT